MLIDEGETPGAAALAAAAAADRSLQQVVANLIPASGPSIDDDELPFSVRSRLNLSKCRCCLGPAVENDLSLSTVANTVAVFEWRRQCPHLRSIKTIRPVQ